MLQHFRLYDLPMNSNRDIIFLVAFEGFTTGSDSITGVLIREWKNK